MYRYFKKIGINDHINPPTTSNNSIALKLSYFGTTTRIKFNGSCLKQDKITYTHGAILSITLFMN